MKYRKLREYIKKEISSILSESKLSENQMTTDEAFRALRDIHSNLPKWRGPEGKHYTELMGQALDVLQAGEISKMMDRERGLNETLDGKAWAKLDRLRDAIGDDDYIIQSLMKAMSTDDANLYLDAMIRDHIDIVGDAENYDNLSEDRYEDVEHMFSGEKEPESRYEQVVRILRMHGNSEEKAKRITRELSQLKENEEPTAAELKKKDSVVSVSNKLQKLKKSMESKAKEYTKAEGDEKEKIKAELKKMTKEKKELEKSIQ